jgi:carboxymethylenebutenolidase
MALEGIQMKRFLKAALLVILLVIGLAIAGVAGVIIFDSLAPAQRVSDFANVTFTGPDGTELQGYLARPAGKVPEQPGPAVVMVHEFFGMNADIIKKADLLAEQGYTVLAADSYRGQTSALIPRAIWLVLSTPRERIALDLDAAYAYLAGLPGVDAAKIGAVGFCFGGTQVMLMGTRNPDLAANVIFYGSGPITDPALLGQIGASGPVLGIFGEMDNSIPLSEVSGFELALNARGVQNTITVYPGVGHAFVNTETIAQPGAAQDAWRQMLEFLKASLQG